jgi:hypothetical protein
VRVQAEQGFRLKNCLHPEVAEFAADAVFSNCVNNFRKAPTTITPTRSNY